jgi:FtsP/CotA-like multicopper oxidase with cupredoxin domain
MGVDLSARALIAGVMQHALSRRITIRLTHPVLVLGALMFGLATIVTGHSVAAPPDWNDDISLAEPIDLNPDPAVVEINLTARVADVTVAPGRSVKAWTYDGGLPGPLIRTRVGDRLIVHFRNELPEPTTVHWHGVRVPIEMDGVPGISQPEVQHGETFTYDFVVRDAGLFWYHPHVMSAAQVGFGLYGALLVEDPNDGVGVADQVTLVLSDIGFDRSGKLDPPDSGGSAGMVFGREAANVLVNGKVLPTLRVRAGAPQRWRIVNAAKSRFFYLDLEGQPFVTIGGDGGLQERSVTSDIVLITPGERLDLLVTPTGSPGSSIILRSMLYNRGYGSVEYRTVEQLMTIAFNNGAPIKAARLPVVRRTIQPPSSIAATNVDVVLTLPPVDAKGQSEFRVNGAPYWRAKPFLARLGETQLWTIRNETDWDHPFHLHGYFFMAVDERGAPLTPMAWKDTLNIPRKSTARFLVSFDERPGEWMFHCHILDHADGGLMGTVRVGDAPTDHAHGHPKKGP